MGVEHRSERMMAASPKLHLREPFDDVTAWEVSSKGWYSGAVVELLDGSRYPVFFYDAGRLAQDLQAEVDGGRPCLAEPAMIVVPEITEAAMLAAVEYLHERGWFGHLRPSGGTA
jgi:hypothetical protein